MLRQAVLWQLLSRNPADAVQAPRAKRFVSHTPTPEEFEKLLGVADATPYGPVARLARLTGARQGELLRLYWYDVDWQYERLSVPGTKTQASARMIDLGPLAIELLQAHRLSEREKRLMLGPGAACGRDEDTVFTNMVGKPMDAGGLKRTWRRIIRDAKVGHVRFHDLRHASATYMIQAGVPLPVVSQRDTRARRPPPTSTHT
jgi:integrase